MVQGVWNSIGLVRNGNNRPRRLATNPKSLNDLIVSRPPYTASNANRCATRTRVSRAGFVVFEMIPNATSVRLNFTNRTAWRPRPQSSKVSLLPPSFAKSNAIRSCTHSRIRLQQLCTTVLYAFVTCVNREACTARPPEFSSRHSGLENFTPAHRRRAAARKYDTMPI